MRALFLCCAAFFAFASIVYGETDNPGPLFPVTVDGLDGYIDGSGKIRIKPQFVRAGAFREGLAAVTVAPEYKTGYINPKGEWVIQPQFAGAGEFSEGLATVHTEVSRASPTLVIDTEGQTRFQETEVGREGGRFKEGLKAVGNGRGKWGYIDRAGKIVIEPQFYQPGDFYGGIASVELDGRTFYIDKTGAPVFTLPFAWSGEFREGLAGVCTGDKQCGYADRSGKLVIEARFHQVEPFSEGLAAAAIGGHWGVIEKSGKWVMKPRLRSLRRGHSPLEEYRDGFARVTLPWGGGELAKRGYIDRAGEFVWRPTN